MNFSKYFEIFISVIISAIRVHGPTVCGSCPDISADAKVRVCISSDTVTHNLLLHKCYTLGISEHGLTQSDSTEKKKTFLKNVTCRVFIPNKCLCQSALRWPPQKAIALKA